MKHVIFFNVFFAVIFTQVLKFTNEWVVLWGIFRMFTVHFSG